MDPHDVLVAFSIFQLFFLVMDVYMLMKTTPDITWENELIFFSALIVTDLVYTVANVLWTLLEYDMISMPFLWVRIVYLVSLLSVGMSAFAFYIFTMIHVYPQLATGRILRVVSTVPALAMVVFGLASLWTGWVFTLTEELYFSQGPLYYLIPGCSSLYLLAVILVSGYTLITSKSYAQRRSSGALLTSVTMIVLCVLIDDLLSKASILPAAVFMAIFVIFIHLQESNINSDALTGMNNRRKAVEYLSERLNSISPKEPLYLYIADMNSFKQVNDVHGHVEGDAALMLCAEALKQTAARYQGCAARYGGDEFLLAWQAREGGGSVEPMDLAREVNELLAAKTAELKKPYHLSISMGYVRCEDREISLNDYIRRADENLYEEKGKFYHRG
ncbi:MAG: GGDEF domain-containing protein [Clostridia bacterium]|nr:GGDEF domain-containing protein [Clostridia bacterium]